MKNANKIFTTFLITLVAMHGAYAAGRGSGKGSAVLAAVGQKIEDKVHENTDKKIKNANEKKDVSATTTFMNNRLKLDKAFTKRYNELFAKGCAKSSKPTCENGGGHGLTKDSTNKSNKKSLEHYEQQMASATSISQLGQIYACAAEDYKECHYIGGAGSTAKTVNGVAGAVDKVSNLGGKQGTDLMGAMGGDVRNIIKSDKGTQLETDGGCSDSVAQGAASTSDGYLNSLANCEKIAQVTLSGYTDEDIKKLEDTYKDKKATEQSLANRTLTATAIAASGIGTMELLQGRAEQKADAEAEQAMDALIATMHCTYGNGKQVKAGPDSIELPGGNDADLMKYRTEYFALAKDLKERKDALGMKPGIEAEEILDKSAMGLYDDESLGIESGAYASLYRAKMLGSETDQKKIDEAKEASAKRVKGGAIAAAGGILVGVAGNALINGKLGDKIKEAKEKLADKKTKAAAEKEEKESLENLKQCLKDGGANNADKLSFKKFVVSTIHLNDIDCKNDPWKSKVTGKDAASLFADSEDENTVSTKIYASFGCQLGDKLLDVSTAMAACQNRDQQTCQCKDTEDHPCTDAEKQQLNDQNAEKCKIDGDTLKITSCIGEMLPNEDGTACITQTTPEA